MKLLTTLLSIALTCLVGCARSQPVTFRVLTYNIHHGEGMDGRIDLYRIAQVIEDADADLVALQEVDHGVQRTDRVDQPGVLAELTGMQAIFERNIEYQGGEYGNAVLSRLPVEHYENHHLPKSLPNEQRGMLEVRIRVGEEKLIFFATHFDYHHDNGERLASVALLKELVEQHHDVPIIAAGDFNALPDSAVIADIPKPL
jgi:endonuclease/exonuclease/phosphatase family metal-dependent hydrolase